jgi:hypothetical protein
VANAVAGALLSAVAKPPRMRMGTCLGAGPIHYRDEPPELPRSWLDRNEHGDLVLKSRT